jgi:hypothetical protein
VPESHVLYAVSSTVLALLHTCEKGICSMIFLSALLHIEDSTIFPHHVGKGTTKISLSVNFPFSLHDTNTASCDRGEGIKASARGKLLALVHWCAFLSSFGALHS